MRFKLYIIALLLSGSCFSQLSDFNYVDFTKADNIAKLHKGHKLDNLPLLSYKLTNKLNTDAEKFRAIYIWVCNNITADKHLDAKAIRKFKKLKHDSIAFAEWTNKFKKKVFKKLLKRKKTMCTGYAYLIKELAFFADIDCNIVNGYSRSATANLDTLELVNHSWNAVKLNNKWYLCDATWSSGYFINGYFTKDYNNGYFLTQPEQFALNHYPEDETWLLNNNTTKTQFITAPLVYGEAFKYGITSLYPKQMHTIVKQNDTLTFSFKTNKPIVKSAISLVEFRLNEARKFKIHHLKNQDNTLTFTTVFKAKGYFDVHLKIQDDIVATYTINVVKN